MVELSVIEVALNKRSAMVEQTQIYSSSVGKRLAELEAAVREIKRAIPAMEELQKLSEILAKFQEMRESLRAVEDLELVSKLETSSIEDELSSVKDVLKVTKEKVEILSEAVKNLARVGVAKVPQKEEERKEVVEISHGRGLKQLVDRIESLQRRVADLERRPAPIEEKAKIRLFAPKEKTPAPSAAAVVDLDKIRSDLAKLEKDLKSEISDVRNLMADLEKKIVELAKPKISRSEEDEKALADIRAKLKALSELSKAKVLKIEDVQSEKVKAAINEVKKSFETVKKEASEKLIDISTRMDIMDKRFKKETAAFKEFESRLDKKAEAIKKLEDFVADSVARFDSTLRLLEKDIADDMKDIEETLRKEDEALRARLSDTERTLSTKLLEIEKKVGDRVEKSLSEIRATLAERTKSEGEFKAGIKRRLDSQDISIGTGLAEVEKKAVERFGRQLAEIRTTLNEHSKLAESFRAETKAKIEENKARIEQTQKSLEPLKNLSEAERRVETAVNTIESRIKANTEALAKLPDIEGNIAKLKSEAADMKAKMSSMTEIENYVADSIARIDSSLRQFESALKSEDEKLKSSLSATNASVSEKFSSLDAKLSEVAKNLDSKVSELSKNIDTKIAEASRNVAVKTAELSKSVDSKLKEVESGLGMVREQAKELEKVKTDLSTVQDALEIIKQTRSEVIHDVEEILAKETDEIMKRGHFDELRKELHQKVDAKLAQVSEATEALEGARKSVEEKISALDERIKEATAAALESKMESLREANKRLVQELEKMREAYFALAQKVETDIMRAPVVIE